MKTNILLKNYKILTLFILLFILIVSVVTYAALKTSSNIYTEFNNTATTEQLNFTGNENITRYVEIYDNQTSIIGNITIQGLSGEWSQVDNITLQTDLDYSGGITTNTTDGSTPTDFWVSAAGSDDVIRHINASGQTESQWDICAGDSAKGGLDYDWFRDTVWVTCWNLGAQEWNLDGTLNQTHDPLTGTTGVAVADEDYIWVASYNGLFRKLNKTSGAIVDSEDGFDTACGFNEDTAFFDMTDEKFYLIERFTTRDKVCILYLNGTFVEYYTKRSETNYGIGLNKVTEPIFDFWTAQGGGTGSDYYYHYQSETLQNPKLYINDSQVWGYSGAFTSTETTDNLTSSINTYLAGCALVDNYCPVPIYFESGTTGNLIWSNLLIQTSDNDNNITISKPIAGQAYTGTPYVEVYVDANETGYDCNYSIDAGTEISLGSIDNATLTTFTISELGEGTQNISVHCFNDSFTSISDTTEFSIDLINVTMQSETKDSTPYFSVNAVVSSTIKYSINGGTNTTICASCTSGSGVVNQLLDWGERTIDFYAENDDVFSYNNTQTVTISKPTLAVQGDDTWKDYLNDTFEVVDYNSSTVLGYDIIVKAKAGNMANIKSNVRYDFIPILVFGNASQDGAGFVDKIILQKSSGTGNQIKITDNGLFPAYSIGDLLNVTVNDNLIYVINADPGIGRNTLGTKLAESVDYAGITYNQSIAIFYNGQTLTGDSSVDYSGHADLIFNPIWNISDISNDGEYIINRSILALQNSSAEIINYTYQEIDTYYYENKTMYLNVNLTLWNNFEEDFNVTAKLTMRNGTIFHIQLYDDGITGGDLYANDSQYYGRYNLTALNYGYWNISYIINDTTNEISTLEFYNYTFGVFENLISQDFPTALVPFGENGELLNSTTNLNLTTTNLSHCQYSLQSFSYPNGNNMVSDDNLTHSIFIDGLRGGYNHSIYVECNSTETDYEEIITPIFYLAVENFARGQFYFSEFRREVCATQEDFGSLWREYQTSPTCSYWQNGYLTCGIFVVFDFDDNNQQFISPTNISGLYVRSWMKLTNITTILSTGTGLINITESAITTDSNNYSLIAYFNESYTLTDTNGSSISFYENQTEEGYLTSDIYSRVTNISTGFVIFNLPSNATLQGRDVDNDNITDYDELFIYYSDPLRSDTDWDGYDDYVEIFTTFTDVNIQNVNSPPLVNYWHYNSTNEVNSSSNETNITSFNVTDIEIIDFILEVSDYDADILSVNWTVNGTEHSTNFNWSLTVNTSYLGTNTIIANISDENETIELTFTLEVLVSNAAPTLDYYNLTPVSPLDSEEIYINATVSDADTGDTLTAYVLLFNNSIAFGTVQSVEVVNGTNTNFYNISSSDTDELEVWIAEIWGGDGTANTTHQNISATIQDTSIPATNITLNDTDVEYNIEDILVIWNVTDNAIDTTDFNITMPDSSILFSSILADGEINLTSTNLTIVGRYNISLFVNDTTGNENLTIAYFNVNDTIAPVCILLSQFPIDINSSSEGIVELIYNCTDGTGINQTRIFLANTVNHTTENNLNSSWRYPSNTKADGLYNEQRATNRNESGWYEPLFSNIYEWNVRDIALNSMKIQDNGTGFATINYTGRDAHIFFHNYYPLDRSTLQQTGINYVEYWGTNIVIEEVHYREIHNNASIVFHTYINGTAPQNSIQYYCNSSYRDEGVAFDDSLNCQNMGAIISGSTYEYSVQNVSYYGISASINGSGYFGTVAVTEIGYVIYTSTAGVGNKWQKYYSDDTTLHGNISMNNSGLLFTSADEGITFTQHNGTPVSFITTIDDNIDNLLLKLYACDTEGNCGFSDTTLDQIGVVPTPPNNPQISYIDDNVNLNGTYSGTITIGTILGLDINVGDNITGNLSLVNQDGSFNHTINTSFTDSGNVINISFDTTSVTDAQYRLNLTNCDDGGLCSSIIDANFTIDNSPPTISFIGCTELNLTAPVDSFNCLINVTDVSGIIDNKTIFYNSVNHTHADDQHYNWSWFYPDDPVNVNGQLACNRNMTSIDSKFQDIEDNAIKYYADDVWSFQAHQYLEDAGIDEMPIIDSGADFTTFNITIPFYCMNNKHIPVACEFFFNHERILYEEIYKNHDMQIAIQTISIHANQTIHFHIGIDDVNATDPVLFYLCNSSANASTVDETTDPNCAFIGSQLDFDTKTSIYRNTTKSVEIVIGINPYNRISGTNISVTGDMTLVMSSEVVSSDAYKLYYLNDTTTGLFTDFNETNLMKIGTASDGWTDDTHTPDLWFSQTTELDTSIYYAHASDIQGNAVNSTLQLDAFGEEPNSAPTASSITNPSTGDNVSGTINITWIDGLDPELDEFNITLILVNHTDDSEVVIADNNVSNGTEYFEFDTTIIIDGTGYNLLIYACDNQDADNCSINSTIGNFTIDNTAPIFDQPLQNFSLRTNESLSYDINATDVTLEVDIYAVNDTNFSINSGTGILTNATALVKGLYELDITVNDTLNNILSGYINVTVINTAPTIDTYMPDYNTSITESDNQTFNITVSDIDIEDTITYSWKENETEVGTDQNYTFVGNDTAVGDYNITIVISDGTDTDSYEWLFSINDTISPEYTLTIEDQTVAYNEQNITINWTTSDNYIDDTVFNITMPNGTILHSSTDANENLSLTILNMTLEGRYNISLFVNDTSGNENSTTDYFTVLVDYTNISAIIENPLDNLARQSSLPLLNITFNVSDYTLDTVWGTFDTVPVTVNELSTGYYEMLSTNIAIGAHVYIIYANDTLNNTNTYNGTYTIIQAAEGTTDSSGSGTSGGSCTPDWECIDWSTCIDGLQNRTCINNRPSCPYNEPDLVQECLMEYSYIITPLTKVKHIENGRTYKDKFEIDVTGTNDKIGKLRVSSSSDFITFSGFRIVDVPIIDGQDIIYSLDIPEDYLGQKEIAVTFKDDKNVMFTRIITLYIQDKVSILDTTTDLLNKEIMVIDSNELTKKAGISQPGDIFASINVKNLLIGVVGLILVSILSIGTISVIRKPRFKKNKKK